MTKPTAKPAANALPPALREIQATKQKKFAEFFRKYPDPFLAWVERQDRKEIRWLYDTLKEPGLSPEKLFCLFAGLSFRFPSIRKLTDYWYRAAYYELADGDLIRIDDVAFAFGIPRSRCYDLAIKEDEYQKQKRPTLGTKLRKEYQSFWTKKRAGLPAYPGIEARLIYALNERLSQNYRHHK
jgi:hypothetical protein